MIKLPKGLEKLIEQRAEAYGVNNRHLKTSQHYRDGGTDIALEVLKHAEKLEIALDLMIRAARDNNCGLRIADETLSDWRAFVGDEPEQPSFEVKINLAGEKCPNCGSTEFMVARDMHSTRHCVRCHHKWATGIGRAFVGDGE